MLATMDTMYQRCTMQEKSLHHEHNKHDGSLPLVGVNTLLPKDHGGDIVAKIELIRSPPEEKGKQIRNVEAFRARGQGEADVIGAHLQAATSLSALQRTARDRRNVLAALTEAVKTHSLGQISRALNEVGGEYRRNM
jgi:methylmalonyl-CoA mutase